MFLFILISFFCSIIIELKKVLANDLPFLEFEKDSRCYLWKPENQYKKMPLLTRKDIEDYIDDDYVEPPVIQLIDSDFDGFKIGNNKKETFPYTFNQRVVTKKMKFPFYEPQLIPVEVANSRIDNIKECNFVFGGSTFNHIMNNDNSNVDYLMYLLPGTKLIVVTKDSFGTERSYEDNQGHAFERLLVGSKKIIHDFESVNHLSVFTAFEKYNILVSAEIDGTQHVKSGSGLRQILTKLQLRQHLESCVMYVVCCF